MLKATPPPSYARLAAEPVHRTSDWGRDEGGMSTCKFGAFGPMNSILSLVTQLRFQAMSVARNM